MDSQVSIEGYFVDLVDDAWRSDTLPEDDITVPSWELADPEADSGDIHLTLKEQEQKWSDIMLSSLSEHHFAVMELPNIGKQCAHAQCKQLDFLPLHCKCGEILCSEHFKMHTQQCDVSKFLTEDELKKIDNMYVCSHSECKERSIIPLVCERCKNHFCVKHRHLSECKTKDEETLKKEKERYATPVRLFNEAKAAVDKQVEKTLAEAKKKPKNREVANKVQLMKIKNKATGLTSIPAVDRVYFNVTHSEKTSPVFVSGQWSIGRAIDAIASEMKLQNNNNKATEKKLRLYTKEENASVASDMAITIKKLLDDKILIDGGSLLIDYVAVN